MKGLSRGKDKGMRFADGGLEVGGGKELGKSMG
jgi:hypothetical protein